jgi:hypothetical protein
MKYKVEKLNKNNMVWGIKIKPCKGKTHVITEERMPVSKALSLLEAILFCKKLNSIIKL